MHTLTLYRHQGCWVYDDATFGRVAEPLVLGASEILDTIIQADLGHPTREPVRVLFSGQPFPDAHRGDWIREDTGGNWYTLGTEEAWLCPALFDYFEQAPASLWVRVLGLETT
jgi:hypothetical protein